jgi:glycosyltransferase involved in cell wall biosynthesis
MKILVVQDYLRSGGTERQSVLLSRGFAAAGHASTLLTFRPGGTLARDLRGVAHRSLQPFDTGLDWWAPGLVDSARRIAPEIVLCMGRMANCYGARLQRALPSAAVVATLRTGKPLPWLFRRSLHRVRHAVANSHEARNVLLTREHVPAEHVSVIHNSLVFPPTLTSGGRDESLRAGQGAAPTTTVLLCVAMFRPEKNQRALVEIVRGLPSELDWQLWLAGDGPARAACVAAAEQAGAADRVRFLGWVTDPTALYRAADVAVLTSYRESLSNFLIEAQAHGLPAVAYNALGVGEAFVPDVSGRLIPMDEPEAFRRALIELIRHPERRAAMGAKAREHACSHFSPHRQLQAYLDLFQRLR